MQLLIDKPRGEEGAERRGRDGGPPTPIVCNIVYICLAFWPHTQFSWIALAAVAVVVVFLLFRTIPNKIAEFYSLRASDSQCNFNQTRSNTYVYIYLAAGGQQVCLCVLVFGFVAVCYSDCIFSKPPVYVFVLQFYSESRQRRQHIGQARGAKHGHRSCRPVPKPVRRPVPGSTSQQLRAAIAPWHFNIYPTYEWTKCRRFVAKNWMRIKAQLL